MTIQRYITHLPPIHLDTSNKQRTVATIVAPSDDKQVAKGRQGRGLRPARLEPLEVGFLFILCFFYDTNDYLKVQCTMHLDTSKKQQTATTKTATTNGLAKGHGRGGAWDRRVSSLWDRFSFSFCVFFHYTNDYLKVQCMHPLWPTSARRVNNKRPSPTWPPATTNGLAKGHGRGRGSRPARLSPLVVGFFSCFYFIY
jgi:hypothetical protein